MIDAPETHYARTDDGLRLAYQMWGEGPPLLIVPALVTNVELEWEHEYLRRVRERLGRRMTIVQFDKRGMGLSDGVDRASTVEERIGDIACIMDAVGWRRASLLGASEGGVMSQLFAAEYPERVDRVVLVNTQVARRYRSRLQDYVREGDAPILSPGELYERFMRVADGWSEDPTPMIELMTPSQLGNESFAHWLGRFQRFACSPKDFVAQVDSAFALGSGGSAERIRAPTLVAHSTGDRTLPCSGGRLLAEIIPGARFLEIEGDDHFAWMMPNWRELMDAVTEFVTGSEADDFTRREFGTVLFTDIVDSTRQSSEIGDQRWRDVLEGHDRITRNLVGQYGGRVVKSTGDGLLALFPMPSQGLACGLAMLKELGGIGVEIRAGIHAGEIEIHDDGDISGLAVNFAARVEQSARNGELWASSILRDVTLGGTTVALADEGEHELKGIEGRWRLFSASAP